MKNYLNMVWYNQVDVIFTTQHQNLIYTYFGNTQVYNHFLPKINNFLNEKLNTPNETLLTYQSISLCHVDINNKIKSNCINYIILLGKYFIFKSKYQKTIPNVMDFKYYLKHNLNLEGLIAKMKGKIDAHQTKLNVFT